jgi:hypothetical protein
MMRHALEPLVFTTEPGPRIVALLASLAALVASETDLTADVTDGVTSGPGNQGTQATVLQAQSGGDGTQLSVPRMMSFGGNPGGTL